MICSTIWKTLDPKNKQWRQIFKVLPPSHPPLYPSRPSPLSSTSSRTAPASSSMSAEITSTTFVASRTSPARKAPSREVRAVCPPPLRRSLVRDKVAQIIELLDDDDKIRMERKKARKFKKKFASKEMSVGSAPAKPAAKPAPAPAAKPVVDNTGIALPVSGKGTFGFGFDKVQKPKKEEKPKPAPKAAPEKKKLAPTQYTASGKPAYVLWFPSHP